MISDLNFYLGGKRQGVSFGEGKCISGEDFKWYEYDEQGRLAKKRHQAGHAGGGTTVYKYENGKIYAQGKSWDDDSDFEPPFMEVKGTEETGNGYEVFYKDGKKVAQKYARTDWRGYSFYINQYIYDDGGRVRCAMRICENEDWADDYIEYTYNEKGQLVKEVGYEDATIYTNRYTEETQ